MEDGEWMDRGVRVGVWYQKGRLCYAETLGIWTAVMPSWKSASDHVGLTLHPLAGDTNKVFLAKMSNNHVKFKSSSNPRYYNGNNSISNYYNSVKNYTDQKLEET